jgi:hypothetical protein
MAENAMAKEDGGKEKGVKEKIVAAIRRAAAEMGRAPSRGELRRITGVSHYRVLAAFPTLREAVRAAGLEPNPKGEKISTEDMLSDWKRVAEKLGRRPSRAEYVREGRYSAGAFVGRFGSWSGISTAKVAKKKPFSRELTRRTRINQELGRANYKETTKRNKIGRSGDRKAGASRVLSGAELHSHKRNERRQNSGESVLRDFDRVALAPVPAPLVGMRRVTESVAQMVVNTLLGSGYWPLDTSNQQSAVSIQPGNIYHGDTEPRRTAEKGGRELTRRARIEEGEFTPHGVNKEGDLDPSLAVNALPFDSAQGSGLRPPAKQDDRWRCADFTARGLYKDRPVMGEPFDRRPMTNAPVNELGVMVLFGMVSAGLGLQVESVQGKFPDCLAKRQVAPGKWQHLRIEFEYESKNFKLHGHDPKGCDMIVCWRHNWKECPAEIEVVELSRLLGM